LAFVNLAFVFLMVITFTALTALRKSSEYPLGPTAHCNSILVLSLKNYWNFCVETIYYFLYPNLGTSSCVNPLSHSPLYLLTLRLICSMKNRADLPPGHDFRANEITALSLRVSRLNYLFSNLILLNTISIWNSNLITMEQLRNNLFA
jgi:hypothetical protein